MRFRAILAPAVLALAVSAPAGAGEGYWASILHDVVEGPARTSDFRWQGRVAPGRTIAASRSTRAVSALASPLH